MRIALGIGIAAIILATGCGGDGPSKARPVPRSVTWTAPGTAAPAPASMRPGPARLHPMTVAGSRPVARPVASVARPEPRPAIDWKNRQRPAVNDSDLTRQGRALLAAVAKNDPSGARGFFFPRKPFTPLKEAGNPDRYWQHINRLYEKDIRRLHRNRNVWAGAIFESLRPDGPPVWIKPGRVHNKIGYYRTRFARLRYRYDGKRYTLFIHTLISWQGHWYVTHLRPPPRRRPRPRQRPIPRPRPPLRP